jgi:hypothetical protein
MKDAFLKSPELYFIVPAPGTGKCHVNKQMADGKRPDDAHKNIRPADPAERIDVGEKFAASVPFDWPVEAPHHPVKMAFKPDGIEAGEEKDRKLAALHRFIDFIPSSPYVPGNTDFQPAGIAGGHAQIDEPVAK